MNNQPLILITYNITQYGGEINEERLTIGNYQKYLR